MVAHCYLRPAMVSGLRQLETFAGPLGAIVAPDHLTRHHQLAHMAMHTFPSSLKHSVVEAPPDWISTTLLDIVNPAAHGVLLCLESLFVRYVVDDIEHVPLDLLDLCDYFAGTWSDFGLAVDLYHVSNLGVFAQNVQQMRDSGDDGKALAEHAILASRL